MEFSRLLYFVSVKYERRNLVVNLWADEPADRNIYMDIDPHSAVIFVNMVFDYCI